MTRQEIIGHWKKGAQDSLDVAHMCLEAGKYEHALFAAHLAVEKILKARYIELRDEAAPYTHELHELAVGLLPALDEGKKSMLREMSRLAVRARYADHQWSSEQATAQHATYWVEHAKELVSFFTAI